MGNGSVNGSQLDVMNEKPANGGEVAPNLQKSAEPAPTGIDPVAAAKKQAVEAEAARKQAAAKLEIAASQAPTIENAPAVNLQAQQAPGAAPEAPQKKEEKGFLESKWEEAKKMIEDPKKYFFGPTDNPEGQNAPNAANGEAGAEKKGIVEGAKKIFSDIKDDFDKSSTGVKIGYIAGGIVGFLVARWLWRKAFGNGQNEGIVKKTGKWVASILAAIGAYMGIKSVKDFVTRATSNPLETISGWFGGGKDKDRKSTKGNEKENPLLPPEQIFAKLDTDQNNSLSLAEFKVAPKKANTTLTPEQIFAQADRDKSNSLNLDEFKKTLLLSRKEGGAPGPLGAARDVVIGAGGEFIDTGGNIVNFTVDQATYWFSDIFEKHPANALAHVVAGGLVLSLGTAGFIVYDAAGRAITKPFKVAATVIDAFRKKQVPEDLWLVYGEAGACYFMGLKGYQTFMMEGAQLMPSKKGVLTMAAKVAGWPYYMTKDALRTYLIACRTEGMAAIGINLKRNSIIGRMLYGKEVMGYIDEIQDEKQAVKAIERWKQLKAEMKVIDQFDNEGFVRVFDKTQLKKIADIRDSIAIRIQKFAETIRAGSLTDETPAVIRTIAGLAKEPDLMHFQEKLGTFIQEEYAASLTAKGASTEAGAAAKAATAGTEAAEAVTTGKAAAAGGEAATEAASTVSKATEGAEEAGRLAKLKEALRNNPRIAAMLEKLKISPQAFLQALKNAKLMKVAGKALPFAGAGLQWWIYTFVEEPEWEAQLKKETDPLKKSVIENQMMSARMNWKLDALGTAAILTPAGITLLLGNTFFRQPMNEGIVEGTQYMLQDRKDLIEKSSGAVLAEIQKSAPGSMVTYGQRTAATVTLESKAFNEGNESARSEAYAAYFEQNVVLPPVTDELLKRENIKDPARKQERLRLLGQDQVKYYTQSAIAFIAHATNNTFTMVTPEILHRAEVYAKSAWEGWIEDRLGKPSSFSRLSWNEKEKRITEGIAREKAGAVVEINKKLAGGAKRTDVLPYFLLESVKDDLALCEATMLSTNFSDKLILKWTNETEMKHVARALFAERLGEKIRQICASGSPITVQTFESARTALIAVLKENPDALAQEGLKNANRAALAKKGERADLLSLTGLLHTGALETAGVKLAA